MSTDPVGAGPLGQAVRLAEEVQALGLACAAAVADRYVDLVDRYLGQQRGPSEGPADPAAQDRMVEVADRMAQVWASSARVMTATLGDVVAGAAPDGAEVLHLPAARPGSVTSAPVWVHNPTTTTVGVTVRTTAFQAADGTSLPPTAVVLDPADPVSVAPGSAQQVRLRVEVPPGTVPAHFHALLTSTATPRQALAVHLEVVPGDGAAG